MHSLQKELISAIVRKAVMECFSTPDDGLTSGEDPLELFNSQRSITLKKEIIRAGRKLWKRQYVDGNGGNISARLSSGYVLCTPTLCSKADLQIDDLSLVDMDNRQICGSRRQTSEILLHLEIYKTVPQAKAVVHCHPPYATAHAIAGVIPQGNLLPEQEVFVGPVALTSYETPGTMEFARTVIPVARQHNTILLASHGVVCWADTVTHAEWYTEVIETYCKTIMIASHLRSPLPEIPAAKIDDLLAMKKRLGLALPDARFAVEPDVLPDKVVEVLGNYLDHQVHVRKDPKSLSPKTKEEVDNLVASMTLQILGLFEKSA
jgi:L-fuculose-phosphate aldolase